MTQQVKNMPVNAEDARDMRSLIPGSGRSQEEEKATLFLQCSCLRNRMDRGAWWATGQSVTKCQIQLNHTHTH